MSITPVSSGAATGAADLQANATQRRTDFQSLASALQSGDLTTAQQALAQLQKDSPRLAQAMNSTTTSDNPRVTDLKSLASALQSGDIAGAQQAMVKLQQDAQGAQKGGHHHHHHGAGAPPAATPASTDNDGSSSTVGSLISATA